MQPKFRTVVDNSVDDEAYVKIVLWVGTVARNKNERGFSLVWTSKRAADWAGRNPVRFGRSGNGRVVRTVRCSAACAEKRRNHVCVAVTVILARACAQ